MVNLVQKKDTPNLASVLKKRAHVFMEENVACLLCLDFSMKAFQTAIACCIMGESTQSGYIPGSLVKSKSKP